MNGCRIFVQRQLSVIFAGSAPVRTSPGAGTTTVPCSMQETHSDFIHPISTEEQRGECSRAHACWHIAMLCV